MSPTRRARLRRRIYNRLPAAVKKHDFEIFAATLGVLGGLPLAMGRVEPSSPNALLPEIIVRVWGGVLTLCSILTLTGLWVGSKKVFPDKAFWMRIEALGLTGLAYFCYIYAGCILTVALNAGWLVSMIVLAFGLVSHVRQAGIKIRLEQLRVGLNLEEKV